MKHNIKHYRVKRIKTRKLEKRKTRAYRLIFRIGISIGKDHERADFYLCSSHMIHLSILQTLNHIGIQTKTRTFQTPQNRFKQGRLAGFINYH